MFLYNLWVCMLVIGFLLLATSIVLIFVLRLPELLDELLGRKAKRQIKRLKELNLGTGSLEGISTDDVYEVMSSGSLLSRELEVVKPKEEQEQESKEKITVESDMPTSKGISSNNSKDCTDDMESDKTNFIEESEATNFIEDDSTSYMEDEGVVGILSDVKNHLNKHIVVIIEEQTSIVS